MIKQIGDLSWVQLSMWDFAPRDCIESFKKCGEHIFHYKLVEVSEVISDTQWKIRCVVELGGVPEELLFSDDREVFMRKDGKRTQIFKEIVQ